MLNVAGFFHLHPTYYTSTKYLFSDWVYSVLPYLQNLVEISSMKTLECPRIRPPKCLDKLPHLHHICSILSQWLVLDFAQCIDHFYFVLQFSSAFIYIFVNGIRKVSLTLLVWQITNTHFVVTVQSVRKCVGGITPLAELTIIFTTYATQQIIRHNSYDMCPTMSIAYSSSYSLTIG